VAVILLLSGMVVAADNPIDKGSMIVDGSAYFSSQSGDWWEDAEGNSLTRISLDPSIGYFVAPSILVGGEVQLMSWSQGDYSMTNWAIGPTVGYYFNLDASRTEAKGALYPYIKAFFLIGQSKTDNGTTTSTTDVMLLGGKGGVVFMLSNAIGLDAGVKFQSDSYKPEGADKSITGTTLMVGAGITAFLW
jgi:hypothetical protein